MEIAPIWINLMPEICWWYLFHKYMNRSFSTAPDIIKPLLKRSILKCVSWLIGAVFFWGGWTSGFSERGSQDLSNGTNVASQLANFCFVCTSIGYEKCKVGVTSRYQCVLNMISKCRPVRIDWYHDVAGQLCIICFASSQIASIASLCSNKDWWDNQNTLYLVLMCRAALFIFSAVHEEEPTSNHCTRFFIGFV
jgi:hypothetical protein